MLANTTLQLLCETKSAISWTGVQAGLGAVLAATIALTSPMAYAAPFETDTGMIPLGEPQSHSGQICTDHFLQEPISLKSNSEISAPLSCAFLRFSDQ